MAKADPYDFTVTASDNACPIVGLSTRAFNVHVKPRAIAEVSILEKSCGWYEAISKIDSNFQGTPSYTWTLLDSNRNIVFDSTIAAFRSTGNFLSRLKSDSLKINKPGTYIIQLFLNNGLVNCPTSYLDTFKVESKLYPNIALKDTAVCPGSDIVLSAQIIGEYSGLTYQWYRGQDTLHGEDSSSLSLSEFDSDSALFYRLVVTDTASCKSSDGISVINLNIPKSGIQSKYVLCQNDILILNLDSSNTDILWSPRSDTSFSLRLTESTLLDVSFVDSIGCDQSVKSNVIFNALPKPELRDSGYCGNSIILDPGHFEKYKWSDSSDMRQLEVNVSGTFTVEVRDSNGCGAISSAKVILYNPSPISLGNDTTFCGDSMVYVLPQRNTYSWSTGESSSSIIVYSSGEYWVNLSDTNGCVASDTVELELLSNVNIPILTKRGDSLFSNQTGIHTWFRDDSQVFGITEPSILVSRIGDYKAVYIDSNGCVSDTSAVFSFTANLPRIESSDFVIYPNPSNGNVSVSVGLDHRITHISLFNSLGKELPCDIEMMAQTAQVSWTSTPGLYFLVVRTNKGSYTRQIIVE